IVVVPTVAALARPAEPAALEIDATVGVAELQATASVRSCVLPSVKVPVAVNWREVPLAIVGVVGVTAIETSVAAVTVSVVVPPMVAEIVVAPTATPVARPPVAAIVAAGVADEAQAACAVTSWRVPSVKTPVARYCWVVPTAIVAFAGVTEMDASVAVLTVSSV